MNNQILYKHLRFLWKNGVLQGNTITPKKSSVLQCKPYILENTVLRRNTADLGVVLQCKPPVLHGNTIYKPFGFEYTFSYTQNFQHFEVDTHCFLSITKIKYTPGYGAHGTQKVLNLKRVLVTRGNTIYKVFYKVKKMCIVRYLKVYLQRVTFVYFIFFTISTGSIRNPFINTYISRGKAPLFPVEL